MTEQILETWQIHNRIHLYLLAGVPAGGLVAVSASKGRTVAEQFAHMHNVRLMWLQSAAPELLQGVRKREKGEDTDASALHEALTASSGRIEELLRRALEGDGRIKGFKPHALAFLGYLISHESHHRGQIVLTLKQAGHPIDRKVGFGLWEWGAR